MKLKPRIEKRSIRPKFRWSVFRDGDLGPRDAFALYKREGGKMSWSMYRRTLNKVNRAVFNHSVDTGEWTKLPFGLGHIAIGRVHNIGASDQRIARGKSWQNYRRMIREGITPKTKANPDGEEWIVIEDKLISVAQIRWIKGRGKMANRSEYNLYIERKSKASMYHAITSRIMRNDLAILDYRPFHQYKNPNTDEYKRPEWLR